MSRSQALALGMPTLKLCLMFNRFKLFLSTKIKKHL